MQFVSYIFFRVFHLFIALIPFWLLYIFSNAFAFALQYLFKYRNKVISNNLTQSYPKKTPDEIRLIKKAIYSNLSDLLLEGIKGLSMSKSALIKRHQVLNPQLIQAVYDKDQSIMLLTGHFNNWEWGIMAFNYYFPFKIIGVYKPLSNIFIDKYLKKRRARAGSILAHMDHTRDYFENYNEKQALYYMAADQSPTNVKRATWLSFLNQDTPCLHGPEKYALKYKLPVVYAHIQRKKRGFYEVQLEWICEDSQLCASTDITKTYSKLLEQDINEEPGSWLWSHRRWKHKDKKPAS